ncbi:host cell division inhibitor Icd-like protein [Pectobacterium carotovorum]|nr:host cell division inhibitor Icd-like protein [Pectobacterium carotovorum]
MADSQSTQTHPKFIWRFLALGMSSRRIIRIVATTEREAREKSPAGCVMVFAGRLPVQEVRYVR